MVIKVQGLKGNAMWLPYPAIARRESGNTSERAALVGFPRRTKRQRKSLALLSSFTILFTILARAELDLRSKDWPGTSDDDVKRIFERYRRLASSIGEDLAEQLEIALSTALDEEEEP